MLINLSSDKIEILTHNNIITLEKNNLEKILPKKLKKINLKDKKNIFIINGPGSFTNLRVGNLTLNIINWLLGNKLNIYDIGKLNFYEFIIKQKILPHLGIIYIGQRKKVRLYDFKKHKYSYILFSELNKFQKNYFFIDKIYNLNHPKKIDFYLKNDTLIIRFNNNIFKIKLNSIPFKKTTIIKPNYIITPNICLKN